MKEIQSIHFVTGKLAEPALREVVEQLARKHHFEFTIDVLPITVAALMTPKWLLRHIEIPDGSTRVLLPGYLESGLEEIRAGLASTIPVDCGPKDVRDLPRLFGEQSFRSEDYGDYAIEIIAEINYAPRYSLDDLLQESKRLVDAGADRIDLGCEPGFRWTNVGDCVKAIRDEGIAISIDSFDSWEVAQATRSGASLVLSVNEKNRTSAPDWGVEVVVVPQNLEEGYLKSLEETVSYLGDQGVPFRLDPILEPIGCGFSASLGRYLETRRHFPDAPMMMGIGNVTELTDADSGAINTLLLGFCEEQQIGSVLTTQVISWSATSVRECDVARRLVHYAVRHRVPPKRLEEGLVMLRDPRRGNYSEQTIAQLAATIKDNNYRVFIDEKQIHLVSAGVHIRGTDPFEMMEELMKIPQSTNVDASHAFYLGHELSKALTALTLGKRYEQDESLHWGVLTRNEKHRRLKRSRRRGE